ncbi:D-ribose pyranase [Testudinibacter sp. TR-2022]|uniref:D-ribose pyranase n=1 Tax=Testudinibacter sp. TR-2022 TaxID=2585029 RepID=UPI0011187329|nr:D-ribose pyranase [Testudinibacter sp. TR-2022]TNH04906.1 D-ribose pyranase [Pasteurellaceae bacterium Phil31]TNH06330.1 D-ribose pyranase [Testudinibacter sp. TR-2022]TNH12399.1 D-ribose pyranase [Testudinibacter sp. TR-2022]TNH16254.1 D-ribose pyranase [Testudinibacter sp. TR-2022]TNH19270.1 D-ribose pyranase [Testudinibacter sp. TR-2022]
MKKTALLNAQLSHLIATLGHTDSLTICDAGLPIPRETERVDLALTAGVPHFVQTVAVVTQELFVESAVLAEEIESQNPEVHQAVLQQLKQLEQQQGNKIALDYVSHEEFKALSCQSKGIVRSGECTPYANVILYSGVPF